jgi:hypothetical protein
LKYNLHILPFYAHLFGGKQQNVLSLKQHSTSGGFQKTQKTTTGCAFSAAGLSNNAQGFTSFDSETHIIYRVKPSTPGLKIFFQSLNIQKDACVGH